MNSADLPPQFLPPVNKSMNTLDRSFFTKEIPFTAATILNNKQISSVRAELSTSGELFQLSSIKNLRNDETVPGAKCFLLRPGIEVQDSTTWSPSLKRLVNENVARLRPYTLTLTYDDWTMQNILEAVLPDLPEDEKETPAGFAQAGHVAHVNLREPYLPYKHLIGQILIDKNPIIKTVINKTLDVGKESVFRTFPYEVLAGPDELDVTVHESGCEFRFNFGKVYWNSRLGTEHARTVERFAPGEAVCDVTSGVGPFAIPAGKKGVFVRANDLNPDSYNGLMWAIERNKVSKYVDGSCMDGRDFIRTATRILRDHRRTVVVQPKIKVPRDASPKSKQQLVDQIQRETKTYEEPASFDHYVMNLPATGPEFLDAFQGIYNGRENEFVPHTERKFPMIHLYLFQVRYDTPEEEHEEIWRRISSHIGTEVRGDDVTLEPELFDVRLVSPKKKFYCATFRLPPDVAFGKADEEVKS